MAEIITRMELYEKVWQEPITKLAKGFGLSDRGLAKLCERHQIPTPERGYWAKLAAGKTVRQLPLPELKPGFADTISISPTVKEKSKPKDHVLAALDNIPLVDIRVPKVIKTPHPIMRVWVDTHEHDLKRDRAGDRVVPLLWHKPFTQLEKRRHRILNALFSYMDRLGYKSRDGGRGELYFDYQGIKIEFTLKEKSKQYRRPLTAEVQAKPWKVDSKWAQEKESTGTLAFRIKSYMEKGLKSEWLETEQQPMEEMLSDIVRTILAAGPLLLQREKDWQEKVRQEREATLERQREVELRRDDQAQWDKFLAIAGCCAEAREAKVLLEALENQLSGSVTGDVDGRSVSEWLNWARAKIERYDLNNMDPRKVFEEVSSVKSRTF